MGGNIELPEYRSCMTWMNDTQRFQRLRDRRRELCSKDRTKRVNILRKKTLDAGKRGYLNSDLTQIYFLLIVSRELTEQDKEVLSEEGVTLPVASRKRSRPVSHDPVRASGSKGSSKPSEKAEKKWQELKHYLDPNPQLRGGPESTSTQKV